MPSPARCRDGVFARALRPEGTVRWCPEMVNEILMTEPRRLLYSTILPQSRGCKASTQRRFQRLGSSHGARIHTSYSSLQRGEREDPPPMQPEKPLLPL
jgi:hypothetical protein